MRETERKRGRGKERDGVPGSAHKKMRRPFRSQATGMRGGKTSMSV